MLKRLLTLFTLAWLLIAPLAAQAKVLLTGTSDLIQVITASGVSTIYVQASWADMTSSAFTPGRTNTQITTATTTTVVGSPASSTQRQLKFLSIYNGHASSSNAVTVQHTDGTTIAIMLKYTLLAGETLEYSEDIGYRVIDANGRLKTAMVPYDGGGTVTADSTAHAQKVLTVDSTGTPITPSTIANEGATISTGATNVLEVLGLNYLYNGTNWVRNLLTGGTTGSTVPAAATYIGGKGSSGNLNGAIICDSYAKYDASTSGSTQMVALSGSTVIYICGYAIHVGGTATNVKLVYGTGSNCATSPSDVTPAWQLLANAGRVIAPTIWAGLKTASAQALCINASAANAVQAEVWYAQF